MATMVQGRVADPMRKFRFAVHTTDARLPPGRVGFSEIDGLGLGDIDTDEYREGNEPPTLRKMLGLTKYGDITFKKGLDLGRHLESWHELAKGDDPDIQFSDNSGGPRISPNVRSESLFVSLMDRVKDEVIYRVVLKNCMPKQFSYDNLSATDSGVLVVSFTVSIEGAAVVQPGPFSVPR